MKGKLTLLGAMLLFGLFVLAAIAVVATIHEAGDAIRETLPEIANNYLIVEGLPDEPAETVVQYHQALDEDDGNSSRTWMVLFILFAAAVAIFLALFLVIGPEGISGMLRQKRLLMLREGRGAGADRARPQQPQRRDDEWMDAAWQRQQPQQPALPTAAPLSTPWLLPATASREEDDAR